MRRWDYTGANADLEAAVAIFRSGLYAQAAEARGADRGGQERGPPRRRVAAAGIADANRDGPDCFLNGARFDPVETNQEMPR